jgi:hypothetical protein
MLDTCVLLVILALLAKDGTTLIRSEGNRIDGYGDLLAKVF